MDAIAFTTLADPTRFRIIEALRQGERAVTDLIEDAGVAQSGVSRHLRILSESGFVRMRPDGQRRLYSLRPEPFRELDSWLAGYRQLWEARLDRFGAALERQRAGEQKAPRKSDAAKHTKAKQPTTRGRGRKG